MMPVWATHIIDEENVGDMVCCPADYFDLPVAGRVDFRSLLADPLPEEGCIIFGGGGLLHGEYVAIFERLERKPNRKLIAWGLGLNLHGELELDYRTWLDVFDFVGVRDYQSRFRYIPCVSCCHPAFDQIRSAPRYEAVIYEQRLGPIILDGAPKWPVLNNRKRPNEFQAVLDFLASGETVITNSYHGACWALLLGRKVVIYKPFSSRFHGLKPAVQFCAEHDWRDKIAKAERAPSNYLDECRVLNAAFFREASSLLRVAV